METVNIRDDGPVRVIEMDRPDALNAFSRQLMDDLADAFMEASGDNAIKVVVLTGAGKAFTAGADLKEMGQPVTTPPKHGFDVLMETIIDFPKPFIVAVNGLGAGIGATICGVADLVYMSSEARLRCPFSSLGLTAEAASTLTFPRLMGRQHATWFLLAAEWMSAEQCLQAGLALEVLAPDALMPRAMEQAHKLGALPLASLQTTKKLMMDPVRDEMKATVEKENRALGAMVNKPANREALAAFREKREADFTGL